MFYQLEDCNATISDTQTTKFYFLNLEILTHSVSYFALLTLIILLYSTRYIFSYILQAYTAIVQLTWNKLTVSIQVIGRMVKLGREDALYHDLILWIGRTQFDQCPLNSTAKYTFDQLGSGGKKTIVSAPTFGVHYLKYNGNWIHLERKILEDALYYQCSSETLTLTTWASQKHILDEILKEASRQHQESEDDRVAIYKCSEKDCDWHQVGTPKNPRSMDSVVLKDGLSERIFQDATTFLKSGDWYNERNIPHRRGYLLFGPPGCGKTSFVKALAGKLGYSISMLSLSSKNLTDDGLTTLLEDAPSKSIILMEDIDAAFKSRKDPNATNIETNLAFQGAAPNFLTFRGLLNALDGVASCEGGQIICMTTNFVDKLDPALIRCGRVDQKIFVDFPEDSQVSRLFERFYPGVSKQMCTKFVEIVHDLSQRVSAAMIQGLFLMHMHSAEDALKNAKKYFKDEFSIEEIKSEKQIPAGVHLYI